MNGDKIGPFEISVRRKAGIEAKPVTGDRDAFAEKAVPPPPRIVIAGGGPAGLMAAETAAAGGARVTVFDRMPSVGRKFLLAGRGGLNLTHSEPQDAFLARYGEAPPGLTAAILAFSPASTRDWCEGLGQPTFVGTSGRVFPVAMKASPLLRAWLARLRALGVEFRFRHRFAGFGEGRILRFETAGGCVEVEADATILALGGASWPKLGSDGGWVRTLLDCGIEVAPLRPSNCGFMVHWSDGFRERFAGTPLKGVSAGFGGEAIRGDMTIVSGGLEGGPVYALSPRLRAVIDAGADAVVTIDLCPALSVLQLETRLAAAPAKQSMANSLRKAAHLAPAAVALVHETLARAEAGAKLSPSALAARIKSLPVHFYAAAPIGRAISTAGGVTFAELDDAFMLRKRPGLFVAGEMLDWEAPTGGYLLQACFATGAAAARGALAWVRHPHSAAKPVADAGGESVSVMDRGSPRIDEPA